MPSSVRTGLQRASDPRPARAPARTRRSRRSSRTVARWRLSQSESRVRIGALASATSAVERDEAPIVSCPLITWWRRPRGTAPRPRKRDRCDRALVATSIVKSARNSRRATPWNCSSISSRNASSAAERLHRLDALDRVDLVRVVAAVGLLELVERSGAATSTEKRISSDVERHGREEHEREPRAVDEHQRERGQRAARRR